MQTKSFKLIFLLIVFNYCSFISAFFNEHSSSAIKKTWISKDREIYTLNIDLYDGFDFIPRIHTLSNGLKMFLSFKRPVSNPKMDYGNHGMIKGYFFEKFGKSSLMFVMAFNKNVVFIKKSYTKNAIKISFKPVQKPTIIIDAGHGGKDPGTRSPYVGQTEKNISLVTAIELRKALLKTGRYNVVLTRDEDKFLSLDDRLSIINSSNGSILISIHTDYNDDSTLRGMSVYTLPDNALSIWENQVIYQDNLKKSKCFAQYLMDYVPKFCKIKNKTCRSGDLKILKNTIPSVLIELGCISNKIDSNLLLSKLFREKAIYAIVYALDKFFKTSNK